MDFGLSEEQQMLQETMRSFVLNECPTSRLREIFDEGSGHDSKLWNALAEMGVAGLVVPEELGGAGLELLDLALVVEVFGEAALPGPFLAHSLATLGVRCAAAEDVSKRILPKLASGEETATIAFQEGERGWAPRDWTVHLKDDRISGVKHVVTHAAIADRFLVGLAGGKLAWVDARAKGIEVIEENGIDRTRPFATIRFENVEAELLSDDQHVAERLIDAASVLLAADAFGAASKLIDLDVAYALTREQFGQPIGQFQAIKHTIARLGTEIEPTRALWWHAAYAFDHLPLEASRAASMAKAHIVEGATRAARESVELHGGYGFTWECEVQI
ncbi:MAG: acyl-CoA dehydrogenase family protein, partial [Myxococcota bacterium]